MCGIRLIFPLHLRKGLTDLKWMPDLEEIRVRIGQPMEFCYSYGSCYLGKTEDHIWFCQEKAYKEKEKELYRVTEQDIREMLNYISNYSLYAFREELRQGYITIEGGHRIGVAGQVTMAGGEITGISPVTFLNIRVAHERIGCAKRMLPLIKEKNGIFCTLIFSAPGAGKTTLLRDAVRELSAGTDDFVKFKVAVVDERSEIAAGCHGIPQNNLGPKTDVLDGCPKSAGMKLMIRSMSPQIIAVDELGREEDFMAVEEAINCGCRVLGTIHAGSVRELTQKSYVYGWMQKSLFQRFVFLEKGMDGKRHITVYDEYLEKIPC